MALYEDIPTVRTRICPDGFTDVYKDGVLLKRVKTPRSQIRQPRESLLYVVKRDGVIRDQYERSKGGYGAHLEDLYAPLK